MVGFVRVSGVEWTVGVGVGENRGGCERLEVLYLISLKPMQCWVPQERDRELVIWGWILAGG